MKQIIYKYKAYYGYVFYIGKKILNMMSVVNLMFDEMEIQRQLGMTGGAVFSFGGAR